MVQGIHDDTIMITTCLNVCKSSTHHYHDNSGIAKWEKHNYLLNIAYAIFSLFTTASVAQQLSHSLAACYLLCGCSVQVKTQVLPNWSSTGPLKGNHSTKWLCHLDCWKIHKGSSQKKPHVDCIIIVLVIKHLLIENLFRYSSNCCSVSSVITLFGVG